MSKEHIAGIWDRIASGFDRVGPRFFARSGRRLVELMQIQSGADVLDVAVGRGAILFPTAERIGPRGHVVGIDLSTGMVSQIVADIRRSELEYVEICQMDADQLAFADASFDFALCGHAIFYFPRAVRGFYRVLRSGGQVGVTTVSKGCCDWLWEAFDAHSPAQEPQAGDKNEERKGLAINTPNGLETALSQAGFECIRIVEQEDEFVYADEKEWWRMMWTLGCRGSMERMDQTTLQSFRSDIFNRLQVFKQSDGVHILFRVLYALGTKPR